MRMRRKLKRNLFLEMKQWKSLWKAQIKSMLEKLNKYQKSKTELLSYSPFFIQFKNTLKTDVVCCLSRLGYLEVVVSSGLTVLDKT